MKRKNKLTPLERLEMVSNSAVGVIKATIDALTKANEEIDAELNLNHKQIDEITETNKALEQLKSGNQRVVKNCEALLK